jgi:putative AbiEi antitoxin of type IV toxin-antitoxin system
VPSETVKTVVQHRFSRSRGNDRPISELARRQHGVVVRWQLMNEGWSEEEIRWRIRNGRLHRLHAGVYAVGHRVIPKQAHWMAAVLAGGPSAVLSHQTAAALWDLRGYSGGAIHVTLPHKSTSSKWIKRHHASLPADETAREQGIPVTSVHRTIFDLAVTEDMDAIVAMIREAEFRNRYDRLSLPHLLERYPGKRGSRKVRAALQRLKSEPPGRKRKGLEERFAPSSGAIACPSPTSTTGSSWAASATASTVTGAVPGRSSSWTAGKATAPARPSAPIGRGTGSCASLVTPSPISLGRSWMTNRRRSLRIYGCC